MYWNEATRAPNELMADRHGDGTSCWHTTSGPLGLFSRWSGPCSLEVENLTLSSASETLRQALVKFRVPLAWRSVNEKGMRTALKPRAARRLTEVAKSRVRLVLPRKRPSSMVTLLSKPPQTMPLRASGLPLASKMRPFWMVGGGAAPVASSVDSADADVCKHCISLNKTSCQSEHAGMRIQGRWQRQAAEQVVMHFSSSWRRTTMFSKHAFLAA